LLAQLSCRFTSLVGSLILFACSVTANGAKNSQRISLAARLRAVLPRTKGGTNDLPERDRQFTSEHSHQNKEEGRSLRAQAPAYFVPKENHVLGRKGKDKTDWNCLRFVKTM